MILGILIGAVIGLVLLSAFFSGSETALTATSRARMYQLAKRGNRKAAIVAALKETPERLIGAILLGNNLVNILASALATSLFIGLFGQTGVVYATLAMTAIVLIFGEVMPKTYAIIHTDRFALGVAPAIRALVAILAPIVIAVEVIVKNTMALIGVDISRADNILSARDEIRSAVDLHAQEGTMVKKDRDMIGGVLDLEDLEISDLMVHRTKMHMIDISRPNSEIISSVLQSGHTRHPVWQDEPDNIVGVLHAKDLLAALQKVQGNADKINISAICTKPWFVPDTTTVTQQLNAFLRRKVHFSIVVDEYGEVMGLLTLEDILEEIVGEIADEHDIEVPGIRPDGNGAYLVDGTTPIRDLNRLLDWHLPDDEATTIAGLILHEAQLIPEKGQAFTFHGFRFEVQARNRNQLTTIKVTRLAG